MGGLFGGQKIPTSPMAPRSPVPVLSPARQPAGIPARSLLAPVVLFSNQLTNWLRLATDKTSPVNSFAADSAMAMGLVVSRGSPGSAVFRSVSVRSRRRTLPARQLPFRAAPAPMLGSPAIDICAYGKMDSSQSYPAATSCNGPDPHHSGLRASRGAAQLRGRRAGQRR